MIAFNLTPRNVCSGSPYVRMSVMEDIVECERTAPGWIMGGARLAGRLIYALHLEQGQQIHGGRQLDGAGGDDQRSSAYDLEIHSNPKKMGYIE